MPKAMRAALNSQQIRDMETGRKVREGAQRGGRRNPARDLQMAREFNRRRVSGCSLSLSALKAEIGATHGLRRSAAIDAVDRGLRKICASASANCPASSEPDSRLQVSSRNGDV